MRVSKQQIKFYYCENLQFTVIYEQAGGKLSNIHTGNEYLNTKPKKID